MQKEQQRIAKQIEKKAKKLKLQKEKEYVKNMMRTTKKLKQKINNNNNNNDIFSTLLYYVPTKIIDYANNIVKPTVSKPKDKNKVIIIINIIIIII